MQTRYLYLNGEIVPVDTACLSPLDIGVLRGYAVFDLLRTVNGRPFLLAEHLERLKASAAHLGLSVPVSDDEIASAIEELLARNAHEEATVRLVLTGGISPDGMAYDPATPTFFILTHELHEPPAEVYENGGKLLTEQHRREIATAKTTNYITMLRNRSRTAEAGAFDLLYHDGEYITEAASASFYIVKDGRIRAPKDDVLHGTIGAYVLDLARDRYEVDLGEVLLADVFEADEAFLTSTTRGVLPIAEIDDRRIGNGSVGPVTAEIVRRFRSAVFGEGMSER